MIYGPDFPYYRENVLMAEKYTAIILDRIKCRNLKKVVSLGIGFGVFCDRAAKVIKDYTLLEDDDELVACHPYAKKMLFEKYKEENIDAVEMCFVLEHVQNPVDLLSYYADMMSKGGRIFVVVPNSMSLHRQIGMKISALDDYQKISNGENDLFHVRTYTYDTIMKTVQDANLRVKDIRGIYLKPFPTKTMETFDEKTIKAFIDMGEKYPEIANAIYLELT